MYTPVSVINLGLAKLGASTINNISPPRTPIENFCSQGYLHWKRSELTKHKWRFARERVTLTPSEILTSGAKRGKYAKPADFLRLIRDNDTEWEERGAWIYSDYHESLTLEYIRNVPENEFDTLFAEALACRIAIECCERATQSNAKMQTASQMYEAAISEAKKLNAFVTGPIAVSDDDDFFSWTTARYYPDA